MANSVKNKMWLNKAKKIVTKINSYRDEYKKLSDEELKAKTKEFKDRYNKGESLDSMLPEAYAVVREASVRVTGMEHFEVQLIGGIALHQGKIAEMKTGEGKTLVATLPAYLNALTGKGVHVVTVNDYLANRDAMQMGKIHEFLGLTVGVVLSESSEVVKKNAYACDITYVTNTELGFDYLRDNMARSLDKVVQRGLEYAIIDEVDSILIDEARTPLIISGAGTDVSKIYLACDILVKNMEKGEADKEFNKIDALLGETPEETGEFIVHEKDKLITLTPKGVEKIENYFGLEKYSDPKNTLIQHVMDLALRANYLMVKDQDYIVRKGEVLIVDTFTGRIMDGRQYSDGLHQAIEAKEGVPIKQETKTIATTTYQNFFNKYKKLSGMTGTAYTERKEFKNTYNLDTVVIPTNKPMIRVDKPDVVYLTKKGKFKGVIEEIKRTHEKGQPILVGTASVKTSEELSDLLTKEGIKHQVLNAKQDAYEAEIISKAGIHGTITIATNMAGRGTDIILDEESIKAGGLKVIGTERHEAQRIDNQLRGRSGRQGDPGESVFYLSTDDDMVRLFGTDKFRHILESGGFGEDESIDSKIFVTSIQKAQQKVEDNHFGMRKNVLEYDRINDKQRELIYQERRRLLAGETVTEEVKYSLNKAVDVLVDAFHSKGKIDYESIIKNYNKMTNSRYNVENIEKKNAKEVKRILKENIMKLYNDEYFDCDATREAHERSSMLTSIDMAWMEQLRALDFLRQGINYVGYAQIDPKSEYAIKAFDLYSKMKNNIYTMTTHTFFNYNPCKMQTITYVVTVDEGKGA